MRKHKQLDNQLWDKNRGFLFYQLKESLRRDFKLLLDSALWDILYSELEQARQHIQEEIEGSR